MSVRKSVRLNSLPEGWADAAALCELLSLAPRLRMIVFLAGGERDVGDVGSAVGLGQPLACHHLRVLRDAGIVGVRRAGRQVLYRLRNKAVVSETGLTLRSADSAVHFTVGPQPPAGP